MIPLFQTVAFGRSWALLGRMLLTAALPPVSAAMDSTPPGDPSFPHLASGASGPDDVIRRALADLDTLERCLQSGESEPRDRTEEVAIQKLRTLYVLAVDDEDHIEDARSTLRFLEERSPVGRSGGDLLEAYTGALRMLEAKHGFWPNVRLRNMRSGLEHLDAAVASDPRHVEIRYLRLVSTAFLPGVLGRSESVREDLAVLARLLPEAVDRYPMRTFDAMASTLLELLPPEHADRSRIQEAHERALREGRPLAPGCSGA